MRQKGELPYFSNLQFPKNEVIFQENYDTFPISHTGSAISEFLLF